MKDLKAELFKVDPQWRFLNETSDSNNSLQPTCGFWCLRCGSLLMCCSGICLFLLGTTNFACESMQRTANAL